MRVYDGGRKLSPAAVAERDAADKERAEAFGAPVPEPDQKERAPRIKQPERSSPQKTEKTAGGETDRDRREQKGQGQRINRWTSRTPQTGKPPPNGARDQPQADATSGAMNSLNELPLRNRR